MTASKYRESWRCPAAPAVTTDGTGRRLLGGDPPPLALRQMLEIRHQAHVLLAGDQTVDGGELPRDADRGAHRLRVGGRIVAADAQLTGVGAGQSVAHATIDGDFMGQVRPASDGNPHRTETTESDPPPCGRASPGDEAALGNELDVHWDLHRTRGGSRADTGTPCEARTV
ncbi:hypothetical protein GCM10023329_26860 [Streptomyces sanyensis]|uniref:Uncharacterized protein n=1 Tax=Streptomyces sanyensis TaxID=568869 RepID=A0ABP9AAZ5_9ACTN